MRLRPAVRDDWKILDMSPSRAELKITRIFSAEEMARIRWGFVPEEMEDKWFIYCEGDRLYFHRSWTGHCIYIVDFQPQGDAFAASKAQVNRDANQYNESDDVYDADLLLYLIDLLLLGRLTEPPEHPADQSPEKRSVRLWSLVGRAAFGDGPDDWLEWRKSS